MSSKKNIALWVLYDFANSIVSIVFLLYFAQWVVVDQGMADIWYNLCYTISAVLLVLTAPILGARLDAGGRRIVGMRFTTVLLALCYSICALAAVHGNGVLALVCFAAGLYMYVLSFTFYTPLINDIAAADVRGRVSGYGVAADYAGQIIGLLVALPFANGAIALFGAAPRAETLLPATVLFFVCALPMLVWFREPVHVSTLPSLALSARRIWWSTKGLLAFPGIGFFLLSFFLFNDAILTALDNFPIYLQQVWSVSDTTKTYLLLATLVTSAIGGAVAGHIADRVGHKRTLMWIVGGWIVIMPALALAPQFTLFVSLTILMGFWFGASWAVSRSVMAYLAPNGKHNLAFAYYGLVERASAFAGPLVWGLVVTGLMSLGSVRYRVAAITLALFIVLGFFALMRVRSDTAA